MVGIRPSPGRVTRGTVNNLFSPLSVQGPMARNIPDLALFLDTMAGWDPADPLTYDAPAKWSSFIRASSGALPPSCRPGGRSTSAATLCSDIRNVT